MCNNKEKTLWKFLQNNTVEIPIIQRDYAQGRIGKEKLREIFLKDLKEALDDKEKTLKLDFIYGSSENGIFQPLDGQQRLTTLWLLHWYIAYKAGKLSEVKETLGNFTYETRVSSREFCKKILELPANDEVKVVDHIKKQTWFYSEWLQDPTIQAMLNMIGGTSVKSNKNEEIIDGLEEVFDDNVTVDEYNKYWELLIGNECPIQFYALELTDFGLTDDLYIKMNARGKPLTSFENFKADFINYIKTKEWENNKELTATFAYKIDTVWTDLFWKYRGDDNLIDNKLVKFIAGIAINYYAENKKIFKNEDEDISKGKNITDESVKRARIERRITLLFNNPNEITPEDFPTEESFEYLKRCLDIYANLKYDELKLEKLTLWWNLLENNLFIDFVKDSVTGYKQRVLFYAQTQYLLKVEEFNSTSFVDWMRVVRNIVQNATINSASTYIGAIGLIKELSENSHSIYDFLAKDEKIKSNFASEQMKEEKLKASIITTNEENKEVIFSMEDTNFFKGQILFGLYCIGIENINDEFDKKLFKSLRVVVCNHLDSYDISNKFRRALLTIRNNDFYEYWGTRSYGTETHKRCFITDIADLKWYFTTGYYKDYLKDLLIQLTEKSLDEIINEYECPQDMPNWKCKIIKDPQLLDEFCKLHYFGISYDHKSCFLYNDWIRPRSRDVCEEIK